MDYIETIPFEYRAKEYILLVQKMVKSECTYFNVTAITPDRQSKLYVNYTLRWDGETMTQIAKQAAKSSTREFIEALCNTIYSQIILKNDR